MITATVQFFMGSPLSGLVTYRGELNTVTGAMAVYVRHFEPRSVASGYMVDGKFIVFDLNGAWSFDVRRAQQEAIFAALSAKLRAALQAQVAA